MVLLTICRMAIRRHTTYYTTICAGCQDFSGCCWKSPLEGLQPDADLRRRDFRPRRRGVRTYHDTELARAIVEAAGSQSPLELAEDPAQEMISVSVDKLCPMLGYVPQKGEFLSGLIERTLGEGQVAGSFSLQARCRGCCQERTGRWGSTPPPCP